MEEMIIISSVISSIVWALVWGFATKKVIYNKGYHENWFWWGFFFGFIAFIIALTRPSNVDPYESMFSFSDATNKISGRPSEEERQANGSWICKKCGKTNPSYASTCSCTLSNYGNERIIQRLEKEKEEQQKRAEEAEKKVVMTESERVDTILKYKNLLDIGAITSEEFEKKKAELLSAETAAGNDKKTTANAIEYTPAENIIKKIVSQNPNGISGANIFKSLPRNISPTDASTGLKHLAEIGELTLTDDLYYSK